jgi:hypothetical protein
MSDPVPAPQADVPPSDEHQSPSLNEKGVAFQDVKDGKDADLEAGGHSFLETSDSEEIILARELQKRSGILRKLRESEEWLDAKVGIETQGIDRIHEEDKRPPSTANV